jgi:hypothetical protein
VTLWGCGGGSSSAEKHTLTGTFRIQGKGHSVTNDDCDVAIANSTPQVEVLETKNAGTATIDKSLATATLVPDPSRPSDSDFCTYTFTADSVPTASNYTIRILGTHDFPESSDSLKANSWVVHYMIQV